VKKFRLIIILTVVLMLFGVSQLSWASEQLYTKDNSNIIIDGDIIKLDLSKLPKMENSKLSKVKAEKLANGAGYKAHFELSLDKNENRKDLRVIEYNRKTNELTVETGILPYDPTGQSLQSLQSTSYASITYRSWSWDPLGLVLNWLSTNLEWSYDGSSIGTYDGSYDTFAYSGITHWYLDGSVQYSQSGNPDWCQADATATFVNWDWHNSDKATYVKYDDNKAVGYPDGSADGSVDVYIWGEDSWLLSYNSVLFRN